MGYLSAILTIGTNEYTTGDNTMWTFSNKLSSFLYYPVYNKSTKSIGLNNGNKESFNLIFTSSTTQTFCSNKFHDSSIPITYAYQDKNVSIPLNDMIYGIAVQVVTFKLTSLLSFGQLKSDAIIINDLNYYSTNNIKFIGSIYGTYFINYKAHSGSSDSNECNYTVTICYSTCKTCNNANIPNDNNHHCDSCFTTSVPMDTQPKDNCYWIDDKFDHFYYSGLPEHRFKECPISCLTCSYKTIAGVSGVTCDTCDIANDYYQKEGENNACYKNDTFLSANPDYILDTTFGSKPIFRKCFSSCKNCQVIGNAGAHHCKDCLLDYSFYEGKGDDTHNCFINTTIYDKYYYKETDNKYYKCHENCRTCTQGGTDASNNCETCKDGYWNPFTNTTNCILKCPKYWITNLFGEVECIDECNEDYPYLISDINKCLSICPPDKPSIYINTCVLNCPPNTNLFKGKCYNSCFPLASSDPLFIPHNISECIETINMYIKDYLDLNQLFIQGNNFILQVYSVPSVIPLNNISQIDFEQCETELRSVYNIPSSDSIIIAKVDIVNSLSSINQIEYNAYNIKGSLLNLAHCNMISMSINYPLAIVRNLNLTQSKTILIKYDIDILDAVSQFYNDICYLFALDKADMTLLDRRNTYLPNAQICEGNCIYKAFDYNTNKSHCVCEIKLVFTAYLIPNTYSPVLTQLHSTNLIMGKCIMIFSINDELLLNCALWILGAIFITQIVLFGVYIFKGGIKVLYHQLNNYLIQYKNSQKTTCAQCVNSISYCKEKDKEKDYAKSNEILHADKLKSKKQMVLKKKIMSVEAVETLPFKLAIKNQQHERILTMWIDLYFCKQIIIRAFSIHSQFDLFTLKLSLAIVQFACLFGVNTLFITDTIISYKFTSSKFNLCSFLLNTIYSSLITYVVTMCLKKLIIFHHLIEALANQTQKVYIKSCNAIIKKAKIKIFIFYAINSIIIASAWYYCTIFCVVYRKTQGTLALTVLGSLCYSFTPLLVITLIIACVKYISFVNRYQRVYKFTILVQKML